MRFGLVIQQKKLGKLKINKVVIIGTFSFPTGVAASSRIMNIAMGFTNHVNQVSVMSIFGPLKNNIRKTLVLNKKINYRYYSLQHFGTTSLILRLKNRLSIFTNSYNLLNDLHNHIDGGENELIFIYGRSSFFCNQFFSFKRKNNWKCKTVFDIVEPPVHINNPVKFFKHPFLFDSILSFNKKNLMRFDLCLFISHELSKKFSINTNKHLVVPSLIYLQRKKNKIKSLETKFKKNKFKITYLGALLKKDNPELLYDFCDDLYNSNIYFELDIIGRYNFFDEGKKWELRFRKSNFKNYINFYPDPDESKLKVLLSGADFLVMFRYPDILQKYTFPTRIVELLYYQKPIIINLFGDLNKYFKNLVNCFDVDEFKLNIKDSWTIMTDKKNINRVVKGGNNLLETYFNSTEMTSKILNKIENE